jgi:ferrous iron transport protein A
MQISRNKGWATSSIPGTKRAQGGSRSMNSLVGANTGQVLHSLDDAKRGQTFTVSAIVSGDPELDAKLREIGFSEGDEVELLTRGPFSGQRLAVRLNRTIIALRSIEARAVAVEPA